MQIEQFLAQHRLPEAYAQAAQTWFIPLADTLASHHRGASRPILVGINGSQGSGKSTLAAFLSFYLETQHSLKVATLSIDDFYLSQSARQQLAARVHPLLATRGVPGTHNIRLALDLVNDLKHDKRVSLPRFNKATDNPLPVSAQPDFQGPADIIIFEGWCWGAEPQPEESLKLPVNLLEEKEDPDGRWRRFVNEQLKGDYQSLFALADYTIMLKAPSFEHVFRWRCEQEHKLAASGVKNATAIMTDAQIARFIQHYQRITESCLATLGFRSDYVFRLDEHRKIIDVTKATA